MVSFLAHLSRRLEWAIVIAHRPLSVCPSSVVRPSGIFDFFSETAEQNSRKLDRKQDLNALYQVCVFRADRKNNMAALASYWLRHFRLLLWNGWTEFNETWQEARSQHPLPSLCFSGRSEKQDGRPGLWFADTFSTSPLKPLNGIQRKLTGSKCFLGRSEKQDGRPGLWKAKTFSTSPLKPLNRIQQNLIGSKISKPCTKFVFFGPIGKTRWPSQPLIGWDIFDFSVETTERNSTNLDRRLDLNALYQVCVFPADQKNKLAAWPLIGWDIFDFFSETTEWNSEKLDGNQDLNALYQVCIFRADRKNKMATLASDWPRHFRLLLWNNWTEFNEIWLEARSQRLLPSLCFFGPIGKTKWPPWPLIGWDILDFSSETAERNSAKLDRKQALNAFYHVCVFQANREKTIWQPWPLIGWDLFDFCSETVKGIRRNLIGSKISTPSTKFVFFRWFGKTKWPPLAYDLLRHFHFFLWNRWIEFNKTWWEARSHNPLPGLRFLGWSEKQDSRPVLWLAETFLTSPLKPLNGIQRNLTGSKFSMSSTKFVFLGLIQKTIWPPWPLIGWDIFWLFLWNRWTAFSETWQEARS